MWASAVRFQDRFQIELRFICSDLSAAFFFCYLEARRGRGQKLASPSHRNVLRKLRVKFLDPRRGLWRKVAEVRVAGVEGEDVKANSSDLRDLSCVERKCASRIQYWQRSSSLLPVG